jgi:hypothetical protein
MEKIEKLLKYDITRNAAIGALIGGLASGYIPFLGWFKGAILGALILAAIGVYKNLSNKSSAITELDIDVIDGDVAEKLAKFDALRKSGAITDEEYQIQKNKLLK